MYAKRDTVFKTLDNLLKHNRHYYQNKNVRQHNAQYYINIIPNWRQKNISRNLSKNHVRALDLRNKMSIQHGDSSRLAYILDSRFQHLVTCLQVGTVLRSTFPKPRLSSSIEVPLKMKATTCETCRAKSSPFCDQFYVNWICNCVCVCVFDF